MIYEVYSKTLKNHILGNNLHYTATPPHTLPIINPTKQLFQRNNITL